jgi:hypothetical protein
LQHLERASSVAAAFSACLLLATAPSQASSPVGTISAELGGEPREWQTNTEAGNTQGTFEGVMCRRESMFAEMDLDDCLTLTGRFDTELLQAE